MQLHIVDILIILAYIVATIFIGFFIRKRAARNLESYFLGDKSMPWYVLGVSNASGMFDITGTMWLVYLMFVYGVSSAWLPWVWPMFNQIFLMVYLAAWLRRSNVLTGAEWIQTRFGKNLGSNLSHISVVVFALVMVVGFLAYAFAGIGKFAATFLPFDISANTYGLVFMGVTTVYVVTGGMFSVVFTEVLQFCIMTIASIAIGVIAMSRISPEMLASVVPNGWRDLFFGWQIDLDWSALMPDVASHFASDEFALFGAFGPFFMMMMFKGFMVSAAGPAPNYDMQRILATRSPKEACKMSAFVNVALFFPRYCMIAGLTILALCFFSSELNAMGAGIDFELVLPFAIRNFVPVGLMGILLAGLLSAFMSTFAATVNAAPAYIVNDVYKRFINPEASSRKLVLLSYVSSLGVVALGIGFGFIAESINQVTLWITAALWGGYAAPNVLKWYWWRLNGFGYFSGMISGIVAALLIPLGSKLGVLPQLTAMESFPFIFCFSLLGCVVVTYATRPEEQGVLMEFYRRVRPWGVWGPVYDMVAAEEPDIEKNTNFLRDMVNVVVGLVWQISLISFPMLLVTKDFRTAGIVLAVIAAAMWFLKKNWLDKLEDWKVCDA